MTKKELIEAIKIQIELIDSQKSFCAHIFKIKIRGDFGEGKFKKEELEALYNFLLDYNKKK